MDGITAPRKIEEQRVAMAEHRAKIATALALFREAFATYAADTTKKFAKHVAVSQHEHTIKLGEKRIAALKRKVEEHVASLPDRIAREMTLEHYGAIPDVSSGQVQAIVARRFDEGVSKILGSVSPIFLSEGYHRGDGMPDEDRRAARPPLVSLLDLPPDLRDLVQRISDAMTDIKIAESKVIYFERQKEKETAADLWERSS